jgi:hypothetical protein
MGSGRTRRWATLPRTSSSPGEGSVSHLLRQYIGLTLGAAPVILHVSSYMRSARDAAGGVPRVCIAGLLRG